MIKKLFLMLSFLALLAAVFAAGWYGRDVYDNQLAGVMPTAAMQMAVSETTVAEPTATATPSPTFVPVPTSTDTPIVTPTSTPTATPLPEWEIECAEVFMVSSKKIKCWQPVVAEDGEVVKVYWVGECIPPESITLKKGPRALDPEEFSVKFVPDRCDRPESEPSPNHFVVRSYAGPGNYTIEFGEYSVVNRRYSESFEWRNAPVASVPTPTPTPAATPELVQSSTPLRGSAASPTEVLHDIPGDGAVQIGTLPYASPVYIWECGSSLPYPEGTYLSLVSHEGDGEVKVGWIVTAAYTGSHPCTYYSAPGVGALVNYLVATEKYGDEEEIRGLPGLQYDPYKWVNDLED